MNPQLSQLKELAELGAKQFATHKDLEVFLKAILRLLKEFETRNKKDVSGLFDAFQQIKGELKNKVETIGSVVKDTNSKEIKKLISAVEAKIPTIPEMPDMEAGMLAMHEQMTTMHEQMMVEFSKEIEKLGEPIRNALELFKEEDDKLKIDAIGHLREELDELKKIQQKGGTVFGGGGGGSGGRITKDYDISSQLNGVLKTFSLPAFYRVISVEFSSAPFSSRRTVDWTTDASAMTITFTSEITASSTLAAGQTVTIIYSEA